MNRHARAVLLRAVICCVLARIRLSMIRFLYYSLTHSNEKNHFKHNIYFCS